MPSLEEDDVEMGNSSSSEIREVEMEDAGSSPEVAAESLQPEHVSNGHVASQEVNGKSDNEKPGPTGADHEIGENSSDEPVDANPSIEQVGSNSPATADEQMTSPAAGVRRSEEDHAKPVAGEGHVASNYEPPTATQSIKMDKEIARLHEVLAEVSPQAAQKVLKEKWRMFLFEDYDEAHIAFILRAGLKNSSQEILDRVLKDDGAFKDTLLKSAMKKPDFIEKVLRKAPGEVVVACIPESTLDYVISERFKTVSGKTLIRWLATAERLGYKIDDILDEEDESVSPNLPSRDNSVELLDVIPTTFVPAQYPSQYQPQPYPPQPPPHFHPQPPHARPQSYPQPARPPYQPPLANPYKDPLLLEQERQALLNNQQAQDVQAARARYTQASDHRKSNAGPNSTILNPRPELGRGQGVPTGPLMCTRCQGSFPPGLFAGYTYHINKKVCEKAPPPGGYKSMCQNCLSGFTTKQGLDYHTIRKVCYGEDIAPATPSFPVSQSVSTPNISASRPPMTIPGPPTPNLGPHSQPQQMVQVSSYTAANQKAPSTVQPPIPINRPASFTPRGPGRPKKVQIRHSPSELPPEKRAAMEQAIIDAETDTAEKIAALSPSLSAEDRQRRITSLQNAIATKKSQIRKAHGVSLRMREKDKLARAAAGIISSAGANRIREYDASSSQSPAGSPPAPSFSPINNNTSRPNPPPSNEYTGPSAQGPYRNPQYNTMSSQPNGRESPLSHVHLNDAASSSGFGILRASAVPPSPYSPSYDAGPPPQVNNKRKHGSQEPIRSGSRTGTPQQSMMMEVSAEDAASKFAKGYRKKMAEREREDRERNTKQRDTSMTDAPASRSGDKQRISIDISSDSDEIELAVVKSVEVDHGADAGAEENEE
ncbi:hypothetical protein VTL71DRAFT_1141 [Oculimacula yallundae]|uniref:C2H2-type domain-containing protein n=1 Tax=Oculimacula yallundae TaxID=86028 RepID=A0ABR4D209_9HELO